MTEYLVGLVVYGLLLVAIAWVGWRRVGDDSDYVLGGRKLRWFVVGLSAGATGMSGWLMLGLPGEVYQVGGSSFWLLLGLVLGIALNWRLVAGPLRDRSAALGDALTIPVFLSARAGSVEGEGLFSTPSLVRRVSGLIVLIFLGLYAATGMVAGGKLFVHVFGLEYQLGVMLIAGTVVFYSLMGGFLSISWSDVLQGLMMVVLLLLTTFLLSGLDTESRLTPEQVAHFANPLLTAEGTAVGWLVIVSGLSWGLGYFGQPHILARFKAMESSAQARRAAPLALMWSTICMSCAAYIGFTARLGLDLPDPERALAYFIELLYNPWIAGFAFAAVLAAMMSTADSQLLVAATAFTHDLLEGERHRSLLLDRLALAGLTVVALLLAMDPDNTVFNLVGA